MEWFAAARQGQTKTVLVSGAAGCGKTALIETFQTSILPQDGWTIAGKFNPHTSVPYAAFREAWQELIQQIGQAAAAEQARW